MERGRSIDIILIITRDRLLLLYDRLLPTTTRSTTTYYYYSDYSDYSDYYTRDHRRQTTKRQTNHRIQSLKLSFSQLHSHLLSLNQTEKGMSSYLKSTVREMIEMRLEADRIISQVFFLFLIFSNFLVILKLVI